MLIKNQTATMRWHSRNKDYYTSKGYVFTKMGDEFTVRVEDLPLQSHSEVMVECDFCKNIITVKYQNYNNCGKGSEGYACTKCKHEKAAVSVKNRYGVDTVFELDDIKEKSKETCMSKYGVYSFSKTDEFKDTIAQKVCSGFYKNGTAPTSKPQLELYRLLKDIYGECELNYPCGRCCLDCVIEVNGTRFDIEFDGQHWHTDIEKDRRRDEFVKSSGYKVIRISGNHKIPTKEQLSSAIHRLLVTDEKFYKITTDTK